MKSLGNALGGGGETAPGLPGGGGGGAGVGMPGRRWIGASGVTGWSGPAAGLGGLSLDGLRLDGLGWTTGAWSDLGLGGGWPADPGLGGAEQQAGAGDPGAHGQRPLQTFCWLESRNGVNGHWT